MDIQVFKAEFKYRLGDAVLYGNNAVGKILDPKSPFHATIGYDYLKTTLRRNRFLDFELLKRIVRDHMKKHQYAAPTSDVLVIHYRAGDRKRVDGDELEELSGHAKSAAASAGLSKVSIVTAFHYGVMVKAHQVDDLTEENLQNLAKLTSKLEENGMTVSIKSSGRIDEDFCYLCHARHLLPTKGGYSVLAGICNPNSVYETFASTTSAIRHYSQMKPVSLGIVEWARLRYKMMKGKNPMRKNINPLSNLLSKLGP